MERVLITGGAGFVGSHLARALLAAGYEVRLLDALLPPVHRRSNGDWPAHLPPEAEQVPGDVRATDDWRRALGGVSVVIHLAAYQDYRHDFSEFWQTNAVGTALLYELAVRHHLPLRKVIVASSQAVYGEGTYHCREHGLVYPPPRPLAQLCQGQWRCVCPRCPGLLELLPTNEAAPLRPASAYGMSKRAQEELALTLGRQFEIPTVALRYSIIQGPWQSRRNAYSGALRVFTQQLQRGEQPAVYEDGRQIRDFISVHDAVRATLTVLEEPRADGRALNVGGDRSYTVGELATALALQLGQAPPGAPTGQFRIGDTRHAHSDISALKAFGWAPRVSMNEIVTEYLEWVATQPPPANRAAMAVEEMRAQGVLRQSDGS